MKLLLIDVDDFFRQHLDQRFRQEGFRLFFAQRFSSVEKIVRLKKIDVALLDLSGLKMEGLRIIRAIKSINPLTEVITINNADQMALSIDVMKLGAFDELLIPLDINALINRIRAAALRRKQTERRKRSLLQVCQDYMAAAAFAEEGEMDTAREFLEEKTSRKNNKGEADEKRKDQDPTRRR